MSGETRSPPPRSDKYWTPLFGKMKICVSCRSKGQKPTTKPTPIPTWICRKCSVKCCEHLCSGKDLTHALCGPCKRAILP